MARTRRTALLLAVAAAAALPAVAAASRVSVARIVIGTAEVPAVVVDGSAGTAPGGSPDRIAGGTGRDSLSNGNGNGTVKCKPFDKPGKDEKKRCPPPSSGGAARADYNGDGFSDLAIGAPGEDVGSVKDVGAVIVVYGSADGLRTSGARLLHPGLSPMAGIQPVEGEQFGSSLAGGDFNGDGYADLAVTGMTPTPDTILNPRRLYVLYGSSSGVGTSAPVIWKVADLPFNRTAALSLVWGNFGLGPAADLAIVGPRTGAASNEMALVLYGSTGGVLGAKATQSIDSGDLGSGELVVNALATGDLGLSGEHELVLGGFGVVHVLYGSPDGLAYSDVIRSEFDFVHGQERSFGDALAIGDFNGDGDGDLAVGARDFGGNYGGAWVCCPGAIHVYRGDRVGGLDLNHRYTFLQEDPENGDWFGAALAAGDFDDDGKRDLAVGAPAEDGSRGAVSILFGASTSAGLSTTRRQFLMQGVGGLFGTAEAGDRFGSVLSAWNWGRGSATDLAIGVPAEDVGTQQDSGVVQVLYGAAGGVGFGGQQLFDQSHFGLSVEAGDYFGLSLY